MKPTTMLLIHQGANFYSLVCVLVKKPSSEAGEQMNSAM